MFIKVNGPDVLGMSDREEDMLHVAYVTLSRIAKKIMCTTSSIM